VTEPEPSGAGRCVASSAGFGSRLGKRLRNSPAATAPPVDDERLYRVIEALDEVAAQTGKSVPQIAINWLLQRPTVSTVLIGARNEAQLRDNLGAVGWELSAEHAALLDAASEITPPYPYYPYWNGQLAERNPAPVKLRNSRRVLGP
jgi:aryl-alcohol dehydrogenase-like predicted oxidoreductase